MYIIMGRVLKARCLGSNSAEQLGDKDRLSLPAHFLEDDYKSIEKGRDYT